MIKDVFGKMAATRAEREEVASTIASARAQAAAGDDYEDDLDSVDADEDAEYETFLEELYSPSLWPVNAFGWFPLCARFFSY